MRHIKFLTVFGCLVMISLFLCNVASADIAIAPLTKTVQVAQGGTKSVIFKVANTADEPVNINISARTWFNLPENADIKIGQWLKLGADKITLAPKQEKGLKFEIVVPKKAKGELAGMIYFAPERKKGQTLGTSYGVSLYVFVKGTEVVKPEIGNVAISKREDLSYLAVTIENKGNVHFRPKVSAVVKAEKEFKEDIILPFGKPIFGGQSYTFLGELKGKLPESGNCTVDVSCNYGDSEDTILKKSVTLNLGKANEEL